MKQVIFGIDGIKQVLVGLNLAADAVKLTLGPKGRNAILGRSYSQPTMTNDGISILNEIVLDDPVQDVGVELLKEVATRTSNEAGDGTTTTTVISQALANKGVEYFSRGLNVVTLKNNLQEKAEKVVEYLETIKKEVTQQKDILRIATISSESPEIGKLIANTFEKVGKEGDISVEPSEGRTIEVKMSDGFEISQGFVSSYMAKDKEMNETTVENPKVIVVNKKIVKTNEIVPILKLCAVNEIEEVVIIADDFSPDVINKLDILRMNGGINVIGIKSPGFADERKVNLLDICSLTKGEMLDIKPFKEINTTAIGELEKIVCRSDKTILYSNKKPTERINYLKNKIKETKSTFEKEKLERNLAKLTNGLAVIQVGAMTETEMNYLRLKIVNGVNAVKAASKQGILPGGGIALAWASLQIEKGTSDEDKAAYEILKFALEAPLRQIVENAGEDSSIVLNEVKKGTGYNALNHTYCTMYKEGIIDPFMVTKNALLNSVSAIGTLLTTGVVVADCRSVDNSK